MLQELITFLFCVAALAAVLASFPGLAGSASPTERRRTHKKFFSERTVNVLPPLESHRRPTISLSPARASIRFRGRS